MIKQILVRCKNCDGKGIKENGLPCIKCFATGLVWEDRHASQSS